jgi:hypothetical protein
MPFRSDKLVLLMDGANLCATVKAVARARMSINISVPPESRAPFLLLHNLHYPLILRSVAERDASRRIEATAGPTWFSERCESIVRETARYGKYCVWMERTRASSP